MHAPDRATTTIRNNTQQPHVPHPQTRCQQPGPSVAPMRVCRLLLHIEACLCKGDCTTSRVQFQCVPNNDLQGWVQAPNEISSLRPGRAKWALAGWLPFGRCLLVAGSSTTREPRTSVLVAREVAAQECHFLSLFRSLNASQCVYLSVCILQSFPFSYITFWAPRRIFGAVIIEREEGEKKNIPTRLAAILRRLKAQSKLNKPSHTTIAS